MAEFSLVPHPDFPSVALTAMRVSVARPGESLSLTYVVEGDLDRVRWPDPATPARTDELWRRTCFEAFVQPDGQAGYIELNLSPSGRWATYSFDARRAGMRIATAVPETVDWVLPVLTARVDLAEIGGSDWRLGLTAVVEAVDGSKSFWALAHAPGPPDFHNPDCFTARLPAPEAP